MAYSTRPFTFNPFTYAQGEDVNYLAELFATQGVVASFPLVAHRRRGAWGTTVPLGVFDNDFRPNAVTWDQHLASRDRITTKAASEEAHGRRPIRRCHDVLELDGQLYYHPEALRVYARYVDHPAFLMALARCLEAEDRQPTLLAPPRDRAAFVPLERRAEVYGKIVRGPDWEPSEDAVLKRWFGQRTVGEHAGHHVRLTDAEWARVLAELPRRNKNGVRNRLVQLNEQLRREFFRDGFVSQARLPEYMSRVLGERPRIPIRPTHRPRR